jgi:hypothetical protein
MILVGLALGAGYTPHLVAQTDEEVLSASKLPTDGQGLLTFFRERTLHLGDVKRIAQLIEQLGDESFEKREEGVSPPSSGGSPGKPSSRRSTSWRNTTPRGPLARCSTTCPPRTTTRSSSPSTTPWARLPSRTASPIPKSWPG